MNDRIKQLTELASELSPKHLKFSNGLLENKTQTQAYIDAGYAAKGAQANSARLISKDIIQKYLELSKCEAQEQALAETTVSETEWLNNQNIILSMSLGQTKIKKHSFAMDESVEAEVSETNLPAANKAQELIARRMGWLTDNKKVQTEPISFHIDLG